MDKKYLCISAPKRQTWIEQYRKGANCRVSLCAHIILLLAAGYSWAVIAGVLFCRTRENQLHWSLDVTFREDQSRLCMGHGAENFAVLRHISLNLLRQELTAKSLPRKRLACALNPDYLLKVLIGEPF